MIHERDSGKRAIAEVFSNKSRCPGYNGVVGIVVSVLVWNIRTPRAPTIFWRSPSASTINRLVNRGPNPEFRLYILPKPMSSICHNFGGVGRMAEKPVQSAE